MHGCLARRFCLALLPECSTGPGNAAERNKDELDTDYTPTNAINAREPQGLSAQAQRASPVCQVPLRLRFAALRPRRLAVGEQDDKIAFLIGVAEFRLGVGSKCPLWDKGKL